MSSTDETSSVLKSPYVMYGAGALALVGAAGGYYSYTKYTEHNDKLTSASETDKASLQETVDQWKMYGMIAAAVGILGLIGAIYLYRKNAKPSEDTVKEKEEAPEPKPIAKDEDDLELDEESIAL